MYRAYKVWIAVPLETNKTLKNTYDELLTLVLAEVLTNNVEKHRFNLQICHIKSLEVKN